jgi:hypothetical protein
MGFVAGRIQRRRADKSARAELALVAADALRISRATAAVVAVGVFTSRGEIRSELESRVAGDERAVS